MGLEISLYLTRSPRDSNWEGRVENDQNFKSSPTWLRSYKKYIKRKIENKDFNGGRPLTPRILSVSGCLLPIEVTTQTFTTMVVLL